MHIQIHTYYIYIYFMNKCNKIKYEELFAIVDQRDENNAK